MRNRFLLLLFVLAYSSTVKAQQKKAVIEEPQPLYRPKEEPKSEPAKPVVEEKPKAVEPKPQA